MLLYSFVALFPCRYQKLGSTRAEKLREAACPNCQEVEPQAVHGRLVLPPSQVKVQTTVTLRSNRKGWV